MWFNDTKNKINMEGKSDFDLSLPLLQFSKNDYWTIGDACTGTQIFGATGSGKTSGSGQAIAKSFLNSGFGGLILTVKPDEKNLWLRYCKETGRENSLIVISPENKWRFNFLDYELKRSGAGAGLTENLVMLFYSVLELVERKSGGGNNENFWERTLKQLLRNTIDLLSISKGSVSLKDMYDVIVSAPDSLEDLQNKEWCDSSFCFQSIYEGEQKAKSSMESNDFELTAKYWLNEFPKLSDRTRSIIVSSFTSMADCFLRGVLRELFCTETNIFPELTHEGAIILFDLPVKEYSDLGLMAQAIFKYIWQKSTERRAIAENSRPVFLWVDESQNFVSSYDFQFQSTARSSRACTVYLTQNLPNYYAVLSGQKGKEEINSLLGNLRTKIFHANDDTTTNNWAVELIGKQWQMKTSINTGSSSNEQGNSKQQGVGRTESLDYEILPREFTTFRKGGFENDFLVDSLLFQGGRFWNANDKSYLHCVFNQK